VLRRARAALPEHRASRPAARCALASPRIAGTPAGEPRRSGAVASAGRALPAGWAPHRRETAVHADADAARL